MKIRPYEEKDAESVMHVLERWREAKRPDESGLIAYHPGQMQNVCAFVVEDDGGQIVAAVWGVPAVEVMLAIDPTFATPRIRLDLVMRLNAKIVSSLWRFGLNRIFCIVNCGKTTRSFVRKAIKKLGWFAVQDPVLCVDPRDVRR